MAALARSLAIVYPAHGRLALVVFNDAGSFFVGANQLQGAGDDALKVLAAWPFQFVLLRLALGSWRELVKAQVDASQRADEIRFLLRHLDAVQGRTVRDVAFLKVILV